MSKYIERRKVNDSLFNTTGGTQPVNHVGLFALIVLIVASDNFP